MKTTILFTLSLLLSLPSLASVPSGTQAIPLLTITNDQDNKKSVLSVLVDRNGLVQGLYSQGGEGPDQAYWMKDVEKPAGVPISERRGYKVITLQGQLNRSTQEGRLTATYLVNALWGTKEFCEFELRKNKNGFYVRNIYTKKPVTRVHVLTSSMGVKQLQGLCPAGK